MCIMHVYLSVCLSVQLFHGQSNDISHCNIFVSLDVCIGIFDILSLRKYGLFHIIYMHVFILQFSFIEGEQQTVITSLNMEDVLNEIRIDKTKTSKSLRKKISVWENKLTAKCLGGLGVAVLVMLVCSIVLPDLYRMARHLYDYDNVYRL